MYMPIVRSLFTSASQTWRPLLFGPIIKLLNCQILAFVNCGLRESTSTSHDLLAVLHRHSIRVRVVVVVALLVVHITRHTLSLL